MDQLDYFLHVFYQRSKQVEANGPGFDGPSENGKPQNRPSASPLARRSGNLRDGG